MPAARADEQPQLTDARKTVSLKFEAQYNSSASKVWPSGQISWRWGELQRTDKGFHFWSVVVSRATPNEQSAWRFAESECISYSDGLLWSSRQLETKSKESPLSLDAAKESFKQVSSSLPSSQFSFVKESGSRSRLIIFPKVFTDTTGSSVKHTNGDLYEITYNIDSIRTVEQFDQKLGFVTSIQGRSVKRPARKGASDDPFDDTAHDAIPESSYSGKLTVISDTEVVWNGVDTQGTTVTQSTQRFFDIHPTDASQRLRLKHPPTNGDPVVLYDAQQIKAVWEDGEIKKLADNAQAIELSQARMNQSRRFSYLIALVGIGIILAVIVWLIRR